MTRGILAIVALFACAAVAQELTPDDVATLAAAIDERYRAFVTLGAYCGLRLGELAGLRRHRVDLLHRHVRVVEQLGRDEHGSWALQQVKTPRAIDP